MNSPSLHEPNKGTSALRHMAQRRTLADRRRAQLVALLYDHGGGMPMSELLAHPNCPPMGETIIYRNPTWFTVGSRNVRLAWIDSSRVKSNRQRLMAQRSGGAA